MKVFLHYWELRSKQLWPEHGRKNTMSSTNRNQTRVTRCKLYVLPMKSPIHPPSAYSPVGNTWRWILWNLPSRPHGTKCKNSHKYHHTGYAHKNHPFWFPFGTYKRQTAISSGLSTWDGQNSECTRWMPRCTRPRAVIKRLLTNLRNWLYSKSTIIPVTVWAYFDLDYHEITVLYKCTSELFPWLAALMEPAMPASPTASN